MNLKKKVLKIDAIEGKQLTMSLDFESAINYQEATGESIFKGVQKISKEMDIIALAHLLASTLKDEEGKAVGIDFIKGLDLQSNLEYFISKMAELMEASLPEKKESKKVNDEETEEELDLDWCWYLGVKILGMSEEEFFQCTPRKLFALTDIHLKMNSSAQENNGQEKEEEYIDNLFI